MKNRKIIGIILIAAAVITAVFFFVENNKDEEDLPNLPTEDNSAAAVSEMEREKMLSEINENATDEKDMDKETAEKVMQLDINIPQEIAEIYFDGDTRFFEEELKDYLIEEDFTLDIAWAKCNQTVTWDHLHNIIYLDFTLNDGLKTTVTAKYYKTKGYVRFNYY